MHELVSIPTSIRQRLEQAEHLQQQGLSGQAENVRIEAMRTLAHSDPRACALLVAASLGNQGIEVTTTEHWIETHVVDRSLFGLSMGQDVVAIPKSRTTTNRFRLF